MHNELSEYYIYLSDNKRKRVVRSDMEFLAHYDETTGKKQTILEHSQGVADLTAQFASIFTDAYWGRILGLYHDIGKYSQEFQNYIHRGGIRGSAPHAPAAGSWFFEQGLRHNNKNLCFLGLYARGHHGGMLDYGADFVPKSYAYHAKHDKNFDYSAYTEELPLADFDELSANDMFGNNAFQKMFLGRMLFSCLVDADYLDTESAMQLEEKPRGGFMSLKEMKSLVDLKTSTFEKPDNSPLNKKRCELLNQCRQAGSDENTKDQNLYTLTMPTGSGKTLSSLSFALNKAVLTGKKRIIYVIPYTSIIEQNAAVFKDILGEGNVIEHHCNIDYEHKDEQDMSYNETLNKINERRKLATENWDAPLIVTTNVQFFESLFSNKPGHCRKLHNIAESVIIFDEAQMLPIEYLKPCVRCIEELVDNYKCCAVLCTATQPSLEKFFKEGSVVEIIKDYQKYYNEFRRNIIKYHGEYAQSELVAALKQHKQALCIVSTKNKAQNLYKAIGKCEGVYHLSTYMTPEHRRNILDEIRERLAQDKECVVISTSLIEAGVDIDFPVVYRELDGLDSIIQAAGRCNREGKRNPEESIVIIFTLADMNSFREQERSVTRSLLQQYASDLGAPEAIRSYFKKLHKLRGDRLDEKQILDFIDSGVNYFYYATIAQRVKIIKDETKSIFIPYNERAREIEQLLRQGVRNRELLREMGKYCVNVYTQAHKNLLGNNKIEMLDENIFVLIDMSIYDNKVGLTIEKYLGGLGIIA